MPTTTSRVARRPGTSRTSRGAAQPASRSHRDDRDLYAPPSSNGGRRRQPEPRGRGSYRDRMRREINAASFSTISVICKVYIAYGIIGVFASAYLLNALPVEPFQSFFIILLCLSVCHLIFPFMCLKKMAAGKVAMYIISVLSLPSFPVGTVLGAMLLINLPKAKVRWR